MKTFEKIIKALKVLMINLIISSLLQNPFISDAMAATKSSKGFSAQDIISITNSALGVYGNYLGQKQQNIQAIISSRQNQQLIQQFSPSCRKADGTGCYVGRGKMFPECQVPASMSNFPANACQSPGSNKDPSAALAEMMTYESIAQGWMNYYDQMSNEASNEPYPTGLRCLTDKQKAMDTKINNMINSLQLLQDKLNQQKQVFRDNNKKLLNQMNQYNDELFGAKNNNLDVKTADFAKYFSPSCQNVIGKEALSSGSANGGLNGIVQGLSSTNIAASNFSMNKASIESDVRREAQKISSDISSGGVDDWLNNSSTQENIKSTKFPAMEAVIKKQAAELATARARIAKDLEKVGYPAPTLDKRFSVDIDKFMVSANDFFKKKYVNDCVSGADKGFTLTKDQILRSISQRSTNNAGTARDSYIAALRNILDSDGVISDKMNQIKVLENTYRDMTITYNDDQKRQVTDTPYSFLMNAISKCEQKYTESDPSSSTNGTAVSNQENAIRAKAALAELKTLNDGFTSKVTSAVFDKVLNCNGESFKAGSSCNADTLQTTSDNFCMAHANQCSNDIQGCYAEANNQVTVRKNKMESLAKIFNKNVADMVASTNALYEQQKAAVMAMTNLIQTNFPGTSFEIPKDMFVATPEMSKEAFGVEMAGNGDLKQILDGEGSMPAKIDLLKKMFQTQRDKVKDETTQYIDSQRMAMKREHDRWQSLKDDACKSSIDSMTKQMAAANAEGMKGQAMMNGSTDKFCKKYYAITEMDNPIGACGKAKDLAELAEKASVRISNEALDFSERFDNVCDSYNNEKEDSTPMCKVKEDGQTIEKPCSMLESKTAESSAKPKAIPLRKICPSAKTSDSDMIAAATKFFPKADQEKIKDSSKIDDVLSTIEKENINDGYFFDELNTLANSSSGSSLCEKIYNSTEPTSNADYVAQKKNVADLKTAKDTLEDTDTSSLPDAEKKAAEAKLKTANRKLADAQADLAKTEEAIKTNKNNRDEILTTLASLNAPAPQEKVDPSKKYLSKLGEHSSGPCDVKNNSQLPKGLPSFDINSFDRGILGSNK